MTTPSLKKYTFDEDFQRKVTACCILDTAFNNRTDGLIKPEYFENEVEGMLVRLVQSFYNKWKKVPNQKLLTQLIKVKEDAKVVKPALAEEMRQLLPDIIGEDISDAEYIAEEIAKFAKHCEIESAFLNSLDLLDKGEFDKIEKRCTDAFKVGIKNEVSNYDVFGEDEIKQREKDKDEKRLGIVSGKSKDVISTGFPSLDGRLYHNGWGKGEFYSMMGAPKSGKSISLAFFAKNAAIKGNNVLFVTLEVSKKIASERIESSVTGVLMKELINKTVEVREKMLEVAKTSGKLIIEEHPNGVWTPRDLKACIQKYKSNGIVFDMIVIDYADIMAPSVRTDNAIENSKSVYLELREIAQVEYAVVLSAMQTNRDGAKSAVARAEHAAEDFNRIRIPDLVISINATDDEKKDGVARLFFAASRNQESGFTVLIEQKIEAMVFIKKIIGFE